MTLDLSIQGIGGKAQAVRRVSIALGVVMAFILLWSGCATGPHYEYAEQADSASIEGPVMPNQGPENGSCTIVIMKIDGLAANFTASHLGVNWLLIDAKKPIFVTPGQHSLVLNITDIDEAYGNVGHGTVGEVGAYTAASNPTIDVELVAGHMYRIGANLEESTIKITLWDETNGVAMRSNVATWTVNSGGAYMEATPLSGGRH